MDSFAASLALERGLAAKTQEAYMRDVRAMARFLAKRGHAGVASVTRGDIIAYLETLQRAAKRASSRARAFIAIKEFFAHMKEMRHVRVDPVEGLESPKKGLVLPKILPEESIRILIESADRLEELDERIAIMAEGNRKTDVTGIDFSGEVRDR